MGGLQRFGWFLTFLAFLGGPSHAAEWQWGGKLDLTRGVTSIEGSGGGGIATWALITGNETVDGVGASLNATLVHAPNYDLRGYGGGVGLFDRAEVSYEHQAFDTGSTGAKLGLGRGFSFDQDILGAKLRLLGDAVYDQDHWTPQVSVGVQYKHNDQGAIIHAIGGKDDSGVDVYLAATKVLLDSSLVLDATVRATRANQTGILGFGGDRNNGYRAEFEGSAGYLVTRRLLVGAEYRTKPDNLGFARESNWGDLFAAYAVNKNFTVTAAYADLGDIATFRRQRAVYLSLQAGF
jgi:hypothetical protein